MMNSINGYQIISLLATGGMASIYLAQQISLKRQVILKILNPGLNEKISTQFVDEGQLIAQLKHPNIVTVFDVGEAFINNTEYHFLVMEYLEGGDLESSIATGMQPPSALEIIEKIADALHLVHREGIIHADVKPANILFRTNGCPVLTDFGISRRRDEHQEMPQANDFFASPLYASPELIQGQEFDHRTDIYSLGVMLYEMLLGKKPFTGKNEMDAIASSITQPVPQLPSNFAALQPLLDGMLEKNQQDRISDARVISRYIKQYRKDHTPPDNNLNNPTKLINAESVIEYISHEVQPRSQKKQSFFLMIGLFTLVSLSVWVYRYSIPQPEWSDKSAAKIEKAAVLAINESINNNTFETHSMNKSEALLVSKTAEGTDNYNDLETEDETPEPETDLLQQVIEVLLARADDSMKSYRLTKPLNNNALHYYHQILEIQPNNQLALEGIKKIVARYEILAINELDKFHYQKAQQFISRGLSIEPQNKRLVELQQQANIVYEPKRMFNKVSEYIQSL